MSREGRRPVVVMVDDEKDFLSVVRMWAEPEFEFVAISEPQDLFDELDARRPDLLVLDVVMPGLGGFQLCRAVRADARLADLPVLFLTGSRKDEDFLRNMEVGGTAFATKPVGRRTLLGLFRELTGAEETVDTAAGD